MNVRRLALGAAVYVVSIVVYFAFAAKSTLTTHTPYNHFALLAEAWLQGHTDLGGPPPAYAGNNDFASYGGRWFVAFPPFPAVLLLPLVAIAGRATDVQDGQFFIWLAGVAPAVLFLVLEKLRRTEHSTLTERHNLLLAALFAFGTVYFFSAVQGTVWYAAHVVAAALLACFVLFALDAERPVLAGTALALGLLTRPSLAFAAPLFVFEALRVAARQGQTLPDASAAWLRSFWQRLDKPRLIRACLLFALPLAIALAITCWHNYTRFGDPFESGYRYLTVRWQERMQKWGLFHYHYLPRNLGVVLTGLPYVRTGSAPFQINGHGLALWVTTPLYVWLLWPRRVTWLYVSVAIAAAAVAIPTLFYQNTGWVQFGYRFSNDYAVLLFVLLAIGGYRLRWLFGAAAVWAVLVNAFGAATFNRAEHSEYYYVEPSQRVLYQPD
jgi:hypothetical protein